jgi:thiamine biosynthesis lipoprotein
MALTLNGIAQGYITDKVGETLRARGFSHVLVSMGEQLALGPKWDGAAWRVGIADPAAPEKAIAEVPLAGGALATSAGYGTSFDRAGRISHILDPRTGRPAETWASISVIAPSATLADGLSTALSVSPRAEGQALLGKLGCRAFAIAEPGSPGNWIDGA